MLLVTFRPLSLTGGKGCLVLVVFIPLGALPLEASGVVSVVCLLLAVLAVRRPSVVLADCSPPSAPTFGLLAEIEGASVFLFVTVCPFRQSIHTGDFKPVL